MRSFSLLLAGFQLVAFATAQQGYGLIPARVEKLKPTLRSNAIRERLYFGPFNVTGQKDRTVQKGPMRQMDPNGILISREISGFCTNCTVLYSKADVHHVNGSRATIASGVYDHHVIVIDQQKHTVPWWLCDARTGLGSSNAAGFIVTGVDEAANYFTTPDGGYKSGYWIGPQQKQFFMNAELTNYQAKNVSVYITTEIEYVKGKVDGYADSSISLLSVTGCNSPDYHPPMGQVQYNASSPQVHIPTNGYIVNAKGHMHDGGVNVVLSLNGKVICDSKAIYGGSGSEMVGPNGEVWDTIREMTQCTTPIPVKAGDVATIKSHYDTSLHPLRQAADGHGGDMEEMGVFFVNFAFTK